MNGSSEIETDGEVPTQLLSLVSQGAADAYFQAYAQNALRLRRRADAIDVVLHFSNGRLSYKDSYAQAA